MIKNLVSIIIPTYNRRNLIEDAIECALQQTYKNIEIIVVDNNSTDGSYEFLVKKYGQNSFVRIFRNEKNIGAVRNWQKCIKFAKGEFCKILWSDDLMEATFIEKAVKILQEERDVAFVYSKVAVIDINTTRKYGGIYYDIEETGRYSKDFFIEDVFKGETKMPVSPGCALFRTKDIIIKGMLPNQFGLDYFKTGAGPDVLIYLFATLNYKYVYYIDEILNVFRAHDGSISCSGVSLYYYYWTAKYYFANQILNHKRYKKILVNEMIAHCIWEGKTCWETCQIVKKCDSGIPIYQIMLMYQKKMLSSLK